jgi:signal transduction histidine kinase
MRHVHPDYPPRARLERVIASARVVLAAGATFAVWLDPTSPVMDPVLVGYSIHSVLVLALVWSPIRFARSWSIVVHAADLIVVSLLMFLQGPSSPFFIYFVFSVVCGALRWSLPGALWTTAAALSVYAGITMSSGLEVVLDDRFIVRCIQLSVLAAMVGYLTAYFARIQREVLGMAAWPRRMPRDANDVIEEVLERATDILAAPRVLLVWEEPEEEYLNLAWREEGRVRWARAAADAYLPIVAEGLDRENFQAADASDPNGRVRLWSRGRFRERRGAAVNDVLRARFEMRAVQSCRLDGDIVHGRVFWFNQRAMRLDDLVMGELVAMLAAARLDAAYFLSRLQESAGLRARVRVARDLHDSILQTLAGLGLQLAVARRLISADRDAAIARLDEMQRQFERVEIEMRSFIRRLRPVPADVRIDHAERFEDRCVDLQRRVEAQWAVIVELEVKLPDTTLPTELADQVFLLVQEAVLNAARHADAATIHVSVQAAKGDLRVEVSDDGKGFPFSGSYELADLNAAGTGPLTLRERVTELHGRLQLDSSDTGARVKITVPVTPAAPAVS